MISNIKKIKVSLNELIKVLNDLREEENIDQLSDIVGIDDGVEAESSSRFRVIYLLKSMESNKRFALEVSLGLNDQIDTILNIFPNASWCEREIFDMFGLSFKKHPDMRRILNDYNFEGHPLRKDFPLSGFFEAVYDEKEEKVVYRKNKLFKEYRNLQTQSSWVGMLPGDEKSEEDFEDKKSKQEGNDK